MFAGLSVPFRSTPNSGLLGYWIAVKMITKSVNMLGMIRASFLRQLFTVFKMPFLTTNSNYYFGKFVQKSLANPVYFHLFTYC